jgi:hypothetical protein
MIAEMIAEMIDAQCFSFKISLRRGEDSLFFPILWKGAEWRESEMQIENESERPAGQTDGRTNLALRERERERGSIDSGYTLRGESWGRQCGRRQVLLIHSQTTGKM